MTNAEIVGTRRALFARGARLPLVTAAIIVLGIATMVSPLTAAVWTLLDRYTELSTQTYYISLAVDAVIILLFVTPMLYGLNTLGWQLCLDERADISCVMAPYRILPRTWLVLLVRLMPAGIIAGGICGGIALWEHADSFSIMAHNATVRTLVYAGIIVTGLIFALLALMLAVRIYLVPAYAFRGDMRVGEAITASFRASSGQACRIVGHLFRYIGWAVLGVLSVGVLLVYRLIPCYCIEYNIFADELLKGYKK